MGILNTDLTRNVCVIIPSGRVYVCVCTWEGGGGKRRVFIFHGGQLTSRGENSRTSSVTSSFKTGR